MTTTTETTTININDVADSFRTEFAGVWRSSIFENLEDKFAEMARQAQDVGQDITKIDADTFIAALASNTTYNRNANDDAQVTEWFNENVRIVDVKKSSTKPGVGDFDAETWLSLFVDEDSTMKDTDDWARAVDIMNYQFDRWRRGVYVPNDGDAAWVQFERRRDRTAVSIIGSVRPVVQQAIPLAYQVIVTGAEEVRLPIPTSSKVDTFIGRFWDEHDINPFEMPGYDSYYWREVLCYMIRRPSSQWTLSEAMRVAGDYSNSLRTWVQSNENIIQNMLDKFFEQYGANLLDNLAPAALIDVDVADLHAWIVEQYGQVPDSLAAFSLRNGVDDFTDALREGEVEESRRVDVLRRMVRAYGWQKFTGKAGRRLLTAAVNSYAEKVKDNPLSTEEWKARWQRRDLAIGYVSGRYGKEQNMCSVLEQAMGELGVPPVREPKRTVRFKSNQFEVEVDVDSWSTDEYTLRDLASRKWRGMTPEQRKDHVVKYEPTYSDIDFGSMSVVAN